MTETQTIAFGGVIALLLLKQPMIAIVWILAITLGILPNDMLIPGIAMMLFVSIFINYKREADK
ncbi:MAG: hypothetical protein HUU12_02500 [Anaerolineales bacterium]|nr:hypothetical protein [Anaerolineales bacterium]NUQ58238.1 hypothetical protein [Anaerolineales bacterium]